MVLRSHPLSLYILLSFLLLSLTVPTSAQNSQSWSVTPFNPPSIPLAVKNPCNNVWAPQGNHSPQIDNRIPRLWDASHDTKGWYAQVLVDGTAYQLLGGPLPDIKAAEQTAVDITPSRTSFSLNAGPIVVNMTFLSPVEANNPIRMSSPFSYLYFTFASNDSSSSHHVQVYSDITGEWISGDDDLQMSWSGTNTGAVTLVEAYLLKNETFQVVGETCQDGVVYYATNSTQATWQIGPSNDIRQSFASGTALSNQALSQPPLRISDQNLTAFGIAVDAGSVTTTTQPIAYVIGIVRDPVIQYLDGQTLSPYYRNKYTSTQQLIGDVLYNFSDVLTTSGRIDEQIISDASMISSNYSDLLAISTRQIFGALDYTIYNSEVNADDINQTDIRVFARDFGDLGSGGVNAVDVLYAAMPAYIYFWPGLIADLLRPLFEFMNSSSYSYPYAAQDLGIYPNATGNNASHTTQIEQSANMIIMSLAYAQSSGHGLLLSKYYELLNSWAGFLVGTTLTPSINETPSISDNISGANQTNLALKGIIAIGAMAKISGLAGKSDDQSYYQGIAEKYAAQWKSLALSTDFISLTYGSSGSGVIYNLYADKLLQTNLIDNSVYDLQTSYYRNQLSKNIYGIMLNDNNSTPLARTDWTMLAAATVTDNSVRDGMIGLVHAYASANQNDSGNDPFAVVYNAATSEEITGGGGGGGINSFAQGALFAPLALNVPIQVVNFPGLSEESPNVSKSKLAAIVGGAVGGFLTVALVLFLSFRYRQRRKAPQTSPSEGVGKKDRKASRVRLGDIEPWTTDRSDVYLSRATSTSQYSDSASDDRSSCTNSLESSLSPEAVSMTPNRPEKGRYATHRPPRRPVDRDAGAPNDTMTVPIFRKPRLETNGARNVQGQGEDRRSGSESGIPEIVVREVAELRREIAQIRIEQDISRSSGRETMSPPSYDGL